MSRGFGISTALAPSAEVGEHHHQPEDVVERQRQHDDLAAGLARLGQDRLELLGIGDEVAVRQHRALREAGGAAGVLEEQDVVAGERHRLEGEVLALREHVGEAHRAGEARVDRGRRDRQPAAVAEVDGDHRLDRRLVEDLGEHRGRAAEDDDGLDAGVVQLVRELARRVERVDVHLRRAGPDDAEHGDREGEDVRAHQRDAVAALDAELRLQPGGDGARRRGRSRVGHGLAEALEGRQVAEAARPPSRRARRQTDRRRRRSRAGRRAVGLDPGLVHRFPPPLRGAHAWWCGSAADVSRPAVAAGRFLLDQAALSCLRRPAIGAITSSVLARARSTNSLAWVADISMRCCA